MSALYRFDLFPLVWPQHNYAPEPYQSVNVGDKCCDQVQVRTRSGKKMFHGVYFFSNYGDKIGFGILLCPRDSVS